MNAKRRFMGSRLLILAWGLAACQSKEPAVVGKAYFAGFGCVKCHTVGGAGGDYGPDLTTVGFRKTPQWLDLWLRNPHGWKPSTVMPNFHLPDAARGALVAYLSAQKGQDYRQGAAPWDDSSLAADPRKRGETIFSKAGCVGCHGRSGVGGYPNNNVAGNKIPALTAVAEGYSKEELKSKIRLGAKPLKDDPSGAEPMIAMPAWGQYLKDDEIDAVADYLISLKPKAAATGGADDF